MLAEMWAIIGLGLGFIVILEVLLALEYNKRIGAEKKAYRYRMYRTQLRDVKQRIIELEAELTEAADAAWGKEEDEQRRQSRPDDVT